MNRLKHSQVDYSGRRTIGFREKMRALAMSRAATRNHSRVEAVVEAMLVARGQPYSTGQAIEGVTVPDFVIVEQRVAIFVDGDYWHANPRLFPRGPMNDLQEKNQARDREANAILRQAGWMVVRIWEQEITKDPVGVGRRLVGILDGGQN